MLVIIEQDISDSAQEFDSDMEEWCDWLWCFDLEPVKEA